ncbi:MAG: hypothetical protein Q8K90_07860, partial [Brevundimonas sp.]|nr:hypothetical protein [Brevundimonas sp.]
MPRTFLATLVIFGFAQGANAQDGPFRIAGLAQDSVFAVAENSIRTNEQGFRTFRFAAVSVEPEAIEVDGREVWSRAGTGSATMDCSAASMRLDRLDVLDENFAVVGSLPATGFEANDMANVTRVVCSAPAELASLSVPFENVRSIADVAHLFTGINSHARPQMRWSALDRSGDQASCLARAHSALLGLGYRADTPSPDWVGVHGSHPTLPIGATIRCTSPDEFV